MKEPTAFDLLALIQECSLHSKKGYEETEGIKMKDGFAFCPECSHLLFWGDAIGDNTQDCYCLSCGKKYIATFEKKNVVEG
jgi:hypothetical protein